MTSHADSFACARARDASTLRCDVVIQLRHIRWGWIAQWGRRKKRQISRRNINVFLFVFRLETFVSEVFCRYFLELVFSSAFKIVSDIVRVSRSCLLESFIFMFQSASFSVLPPQIQSWFKLEYKLSWHYDITTNLIDSWLAKLIRYHKKFATLPQNEETH